MSNAYENMVNTLGKSFNPELLPNRHLIMKSAKNLCETFKKAGFPLPKVEIQDLTCAQNQVQFNSNDQTNTGNAFCRVYDPQHNPLKVPEDAFKNDDNNNYLNRGYACKKGNDHGLDFNLNLDSFKSPETLTCQGVARNNAAPLLALATNMNPILERMEGAAVNNKVAQGLYLKALRKKQVDAIKSALAKNIDFITGNNDLLAKAKASLEKLDKCGLGDQSLKDALKKKENPEEMAKNRAARDKAYEDMISDKPGPGGLSARDQIQKYVALKRKVSSEKDNKFGQRNNYNKWFQGLPAENQTRYQSTHQSLQYLYSQRINLRNSQDFYKMQQNETYAQKAQIQTEDIEKAIRTQETYAASLTNYDDYKVHQGMEEEEEYVKNFERGPYAFMIDPEDMKNRIGGFMNMFANHLREGNPVESKKACPNDGKMRMNNSDCTIPGKKDLLRDDGSHHVFSGTANYSAPDQSVKTIGDQYDRAFKFGLYQLDNMYGCDAMPDEMINGDYNPDESIASDEVWSKSMPFLTSLTGGRKYEFLPTELMEKVSSEGWSTKGYNGLAKNSPEQKMYQVQGVLTLMKNQHLRQSVMNDFPELAKIDCSFSNEVDDKFHKLQHFPTIQKAGMIFDGLAITGAAIGTSLIPGVGPLATAGVIGYAGYVYVTNAQEEASAAEHRYKLKASSFYNGSLTDVTGEQVGEAMQEAIDADAGVYEQMAWAGVDVVTLGAGTKVAAARRTMVLTKSKTLFKESVEKSSQGVKNAAERTKIYREHRALLETGHFVKLAAKEIPLTQFVATELTTTAKQISKDVFTGREWIKSGQAAAQMAKAVAYPILHPIKTLIAAKRALLEQTVTVQEVLLKNSKIKSAPKDLLSMSEGKFKEWITKNNPSRIEIIDAQKQRVLLDSMVKYGQNIPFSKRAEKIKILAKVLESRNGQELLAAIIKNPEAGERFFSAFSNRAIVTLNENLAQETENLLEQFIKPITPTNRNQRKIVAKAPPVTLGPGRKILEEKAKYFLEHERKRNPHIPTPANTHLGQWMIMMMSSALA
jgi:hypothetical protein